MEVHFLRRCWWPWWYRRVVAPVQLVVSTLDYESMMDAAATVYDVGDIEIAGADWAFADVSGSSIGIGRSRDLQSRGLSLNHLA